MQTILNSAVHMWVRHISIGGHSFHPSIFHEIVVKNQCLDLIWTNYARFFFMVEANIFVIT